MTIMRGSGGRLGIQKCRDQMSGEDWRVMEMIGEDLRGDREYPEEWDDEWDASI